MRRRSRLAVTFVALLMVGWSVVTTEPRGHALAADPQAELQRTRQQLADAQADQQALTQALEQQRARLSELQQQSATLTVHLDLAVAELTAVTAEYDRVAGLLAQVRLQVEEITNRLAELRAQIAELDALLMEVAREIDARTQDLHLRERLLEEHLRAAYETSQTSLLEVLLSAESLDEATTQVGYLLAVSDQDVALANEIRTIRTELETRQATLTDGRRALREARSAAQVEEGLLLQRQDELTVLEGQLAVLQVAAEQKQAEQEAALNDSLAAKGDVEAQIAANERAATEAANLAAQLRQQAAAQQAAVDEARRRAAAEAARQAQQAAAAASRTSAHGFRWPEPGARITQEWGPTTFRLEPPYTYKGTWYAHFHGGIDTAAGCGTQIRAAGPGVVVASGQPLAPWDSGYGVVVEHGNGIQTWYWHLQARVLVSPGQIVTGETVIGLEGSTGNSTGCHLHFAVNDRGVWENPRWYLP